MQKGIRDFLPTVPAHWKATAQIQAFGLWKIPLLFSVRPIVRQIEDHRAMVEIPLTRWTKNHMGSMYFGALSIGADSVVGILAIHHMQKQSNKINFIFKDFKADFLRRAEENVIFVCDEGKKISKLVKEAANSSERKNLSIDAYAAPKSDLKNPLARFTLTISLKRKS